MISNPEPSADELEFKSADENSKNPVGMKESVLMKNPVLMENPVLTKNLAVPRVRVRKTSAQGHVSAV